MGDPLALVFSNTTIIALPSNYAFCDADVGYWLLIWKLVMYLNDCLTLPDTQLSGSEAV